MTQIFTTLLSLLKEIHGLYIDKDKGQLYEPIMPGVAMPCALISISLPTCELIDQHTSDALVDISLKVVFDSMGEITDSLTDQDRLDASLAQYAMIDTIHATLQGFRNSHLSPLHRSSCRELHQQGLCVYEMIYSSSFTDYV